MRVRLWAVGRVASVASVTSVTSVTSVADIGAVATCMAAASVPDMEIMPSGVSADVAKMAEMRVSDAQECRDQQKGA